MKRPVPWLLWLVIGFGGGLGCEGVSVMDIVEHHAIDGGLADADPRPVVLAAEPPPPVVGGGLARLGDRAVVADHDRDRILVLDLERGLALAEHRAVRPGRVALADDRAYVATPGGVVVLGLRDGRRVGTLPSCAAPQGLAVDGPVLHVACRGGALLRIDVDTGAQIDRRWLDGDLRDVIVVEGRPWVSRFATAEILVVDDHEVVRLPAPERVEADGEWQGRVGWRLRRLSDGRVALLHQWHRIDRAPVGYGRARTDCHGGRVVPGITMYPPDAHERPSAGRQRHAIGGAVLVVDFAVSEDWVGLATPGERDARDPYAAPPLDADDVPLRRIPLQRLGGTPGAGARCVAVRAGGRGRTRSIAVANGGDGGDGGDDLIFLGRDNGLQAFDAGGAPLPWIGGAPIIDTGHDLFHIDAGGGVSCANCHPGGGDDGHTWSLGAGGPRRTQPLYGGLTGTAPYHWDGSLPDASALVDRVRRRLMGGGPLTDDARDALVRWLDGLEWPEVDHPASADRIAAGERIFVRRACDACHAGDEYTDGRSHTIDGRPIQTPSLRGLALRESLTHRGCAAGIAERLVGADGPCGDPLHPRVAPDELEDLIAFLSSL